MKPMDKKRVAWLSVTSNTLLTSGKLVAGLYSGSVSILSEAAHSGIDLIASGIATFSVHMADRPPDLDHQYGHEKVENVSGVIEGLLIFGAAAWIVNEAVNKLIHGVTLQHLGPGIAVMGASALINLVVATLLRRSAVASRSVALEADAAHLYTDVYTSAGVLLGLSAIWVGQRFFHANVIWLDPAIAIGVALLILSAALRITVKSFKPLMDMAASPEDVAIVEEAMTEFGKEGADFHKVRTRNAGGVLHVDLHMGCKPGVSLERGHTISHRLKARIEQRLPMARVLIHVEPSHRTEVLPESDEQVKCMRAELSRDPRVLSINRLQALRYNQEVRIEATLALDPAVNLAESRALTVILEDRLHVCLPEVQEIVLTLLPGDGWQEAIHEDDRKRICNLVGEHESRFTAIHELRVASAGGRHAVRLRLGVPRLLPVIAASEIASHIEADIRELFPQGIEIDLHIEPCNETCSNCHAICPERKTAGAGALTSSGRT
jgi:cation diffusion facilitator family transporter